MTKYINLFKYKIDKKYYTIKQNVEYVPHEYMFMYEPEMLI